MKSFCKIQVLSISLKFEETQRAMARSTRKHESHPLCVGVESTIAYLSVIAFPKFRTLFPSEVCQRMGRLRAGRMSNQDLTRGTSVSPKSSSPGSVPRPKASQQYGQPRTNDWSGHCRLTFTERDGEELFEISV
jgi:hypothetical protein